ncbi:hypothetical protein Esti_004886 [Eimeria stiedai]
MGMEPRDRQGQAELWDICDFIDVVGSVALNARQPLPQPAAASTTAGAPTTAGTGGDSSAPPAAPASEAPPTADEPVEPVKASAEGSTADIQKEDSDAADKTTLRAECGEAGAPAKDQGKQTPGAPPTAAPAPTCEVATLQQLLQNKLNSLALVSDVDEQLLLNVSFKQPVRLTAFSMLASTPPAGFSASADAEDSVSGPMLVKVFCNKSSLNFCGVADEACAFSVMLSVEDILQERRIPLPGSKFQMCSSVQLFVQENQEGSTYSFINRLALFGVAHKRYS